MDVDGFDLIELVELFRSGQGDKAIASALFTRLGDAVQLHIHAALLNYGQIHTSFYPVNEQDFEDLNHDVWVRLFPGFRRMNPRSESSIYLYIKLTARSVVKEYIRKKKTAAAHAPLRAKESRSPEKVYSMQEEIDKVRAALGDYRGEEREKKITIFRLRHYHGLMPREITKIPWIDCHEEEIYMILKEMKEFLRGKLKKS